MWLLVLIAHAHHAGQLSLPRAATLPIRARARPPICTVPVDIGGLASDVLLQVTLRQLDGPGLQDWLCKRPYSLALPVQPMVWLPVEGPPRGVELRFRRKPSDEKGGTDGGLRFIIDDSDARHGSLLVTRMSEGQYIAKAYSEKAIVKLILSELERLPVEVAEVAAVLRP